jgi:hypothetical protein
VENARKSVSPRTRTNNARPPIRSSVSGELEAAAAAGATRGSVTLVFFAGRERAGFFFTALCTRDGVGCTTTGGDGGGVNTGVGEGAGGVGAGAGG